MKSQIFAILITTLISSLGLADLSQEYILQERMKTKSFGIPGCEQEEGDCDRVFAQLRVQASQVSQVEKKYVDTPMGYCVDSYVKLKDGRILYLREE